MDDASSDSPARETDSGIEKNTGSKKSLFQRIWHPEPVPPAFARKDGEPVLIPESTASWLSQTLFTWIYPLLWVGYTRPLEMEDLWRLPETRLAHYMADRLGDEFYKRCPEELKPAMWRKTPPTTEKDRISEDGTSENEPDEKMAKEKRRASQVPIQDEEKRAEAHGIDLESKANGEQEQTNKKTWFWKQKSTVTNDTTNEKSNTTKISENKSQNKPPFRYGKVFFEALHSTLLWRWWAAGVLKLIGDTLQTTSPLVNKALLTWLAESFAFHRFGTVPGVADTKPRGVGYGIGLVIALFAMQELSSLATNQYQILTMTNGMAVRAGVISLIFRKSLRLSGKSRAKHSTGQITTLISTDATRLDLAGAVVHNLWTNPIQLAIGIGLLIGNLKVAALVGLGVLLIGFPIQAIFVRIMVAKRKQGVELTDQRVRVLNEILQGIRLIKLYVWEKFYIDRIVDLRRREIKTIRVRSLARASIFACVTAIPIIASVLSFITYALTGHPLNPAIIFTSLQFLNIIRQPLIFFPFVIAICADSYVALGRIGAFLTAEELGETYTIDNNSKWAVKIKGMFAWETVEGLPGNEKDGADPGAKKAAKSAGAKSKKGRKKGKKGDSVLPTAASSVTNSGAATPKEGAEKEKEEKPFELKDVDVCVPKGLFVAIVGRVGTGKSSLLQAMIGEMRKVEGEVVFGGDVAYVPQTPWIMNATLRDNVLFGREVNEGRFQEIVNACSLVHDLEMLPNGEMTEIGEKGINLSGGQKARVSLARAAYSNCSVVLLDDPLSAVDAHVGKAILENCLLKGPLSDKTRILVTHALHVLPHADYIYVMDGGNIVEEGTYQDLLSKGKSFTRLVEEYGSQEKSSEKQADEEALQEGKELDKEAAQELDKGEAATASKGLALMQQEERNTGQVETITYVKYLKAAGGLMWGPALILLLALTQAAQVGNNLFLGFWTANSIPGFKQGDYMALYAALGIAQGILTFIGSFAFSLFGLRAGLQLFRMALQGVVRSPVSFYDTTPIGRILSRLSKDQDVLDNQLADVMYQLFLTFFSVFGTIALVFYAFPYLGIIFVPLSIIYYACATFYRRSSVEAKRLDSLLRSLLYASYTETLTGLSTVRAYREQDRFIHNSEQALDVENRAYYLTIAIQRWLGVRLDLLGNILILGIGVFAVAFRESVDPSKIGVVLSYTLMITQTLSAMVTQFAQTEQNMNSVERLVVYSDLLPEGDLQTPNDPPMSWPSAGAIEFKNVALAYREGLPLVLKDVSFQIRAGEKIGIVGRTGAGKSSLLQALFRIVELKEGSITIDGVNCRHIGLDILRRQLAVIPQDSVLFLGTLRDNLDPQRSRTDAELISALRRAWLLPQEGFSDPVAEAKFSLDSSVGDEGSNFSAGEKQLLALCRALVKDSKIIILDEATSSVDVETDSKLQSTIQREFSSSTLLCIAHRLNTIVYYDRVLVMDSGHVAEFDTPLNLFDRTDSVFRSLCDEANLSRQDIIKIRGNVEKGYEG